MDGKGNNKKEGKSVNLEVISKDSKMNYDERRLLPRLSVNTEQFRHSRTGKIYSVMDLSKGGLAFWLTDRDDIQLFNVGNLLEGTLNLRRQKYLIQLQVRNLRPDRIGCEFKNLTPGVEQAIFRFLDPKLLGEELKPIPSSDLSTLWYNAPTSADLLLHKGTDGKYDRMTLYILGSYVQWDQERGLLTGRTTPSEDQSEVRGVLRFETLLLKSDPAVDSGKLDVAKTALLSSNLPEDLKGWCLRQLER